jgi:hypothetical protein
MKQNGISDETIHLVTYKNAIDAFGQSGQLHEKDFTTAQQVDQSLKFQGNTILRGGQQPRINKDSLIIR